MGGSGASKTTPGVSLRGQTRSGDATGGSVAAAVTKRVGTVGRPDGAWSPQPQSDRRTNPASSALGPPQQDRFGDADDGCGADLAAQQDRVGFAPQQLSPAASPQRQTRPAASQAQAFFGAARIAPASTSSAVPKLSSIRLMRTRRGREGGTDEL